MARTTVPPSVQHWLELRKKHLQSPSSGPRVLPIVKIGRTWYFADERCRELRNVQNPGDILRFETDGDMLVFLGQHGHWAD